MRGGGGGGGGTKSAGTSVFKTTKHGSVSLALPDKLYWIDLTVHMDIQRNPGPVSSEPSAQFQPLLCKSNLPVLIKYSRTELLNLRTNAFISPELLPKLNVCHYNYTCPQSCNALPTSFPIPVLRSTRLGRNNTTRDCKYTKRTTIHRIRNISNLVPVQRVDLHKPRSNIKFGIWNAQSMNK